MAIQGEGAIFTLVRCADSDGWLRQRQQGIGGSDVAAIMGLSPWRSPLDVWLEKTGREQPKDLSDKPYVDFGNIMEPIIGGRYAGTNPDRRVRRVNAVCKSIERPWAQASLDYEVRDEDGRWGVLEIKTARTAKDWEDGVPAYYLTQVTHYMSVTGRDFADVAVFFRDSCEYRVLRVNRDEEDVQAVNAAVDEFWNDYVLKDQMPQLTGADGEAQGLARLWPNPSDELAQDLSAEADALVADYQDAADREKRAKDDKRIAATKLMGRIGERKGIVTDVAKVTWTRSEQEVFDSKRFRAEHPDLWQAYAKTEVRSRGLRISEVR